MRSGKVRYLGASSMAAWQLAKALFTADARSWRRFVSMQNHYNLAYREEERETIPLCLDQGLGVIPWSPLARGFLTGTRTRQGEARTVRAKTDRFSESLYVRDVDHDVVDALARVAAARGETPARVALAWLLSVPGVTAPIVGVTKTEHLRDAVRAVDLELSPEEIEALEAPYLPNEIRGHVQPSPRTFHEQKRYIARPAPKKP